MYHPLPTHFSGLRAKVTQGVGGRAWIQTLEPTRSTTINTAPHFTSGSRILSQQPTQLESCSSWYLFHFDSEL